MGFRTGAIATIWKVEEVSPKITKGQISTSRKNKETGEWETDFSAFVAFVGTATAAKALQLHKQDRIRLKDIEVTSKYDKAKNMTYTNFTIFSFEDPNANTEAEQPKAEDKAEARTEPELEIDDSQLPF